MWCTWFISVPYIWYPYLLTLLYLSQPFILHTNSVNYIKFPIVCCISRQATFRDKIMKLQIKKMVKFDVHISPIFSCWLTYCFNGKLKSCNVFVITSFRQTSVRFSRYSVSSEDSWVTTFALLHNHYGFIVTLSRWGWCGKSFFSCTSTRTPSINTKTVTDVLLSCVLCISYLLRKQNAVLEALASTVTEVL